LFREGDPQALHLHGKTGLVRALHQKMGVIGENREMDDRKPMHPGTGDGLLEAAKEILAAQARETVVETERDVDGMARFEALPRQVGLKAGDLRSPGAFAAAAVGLRRAQVELELARAAMGLK